MTFKEDYQALFEPLQPSQRLMAETAALSRNRRERWALRWRLPAAATALCTICLLVAASFGLQLGASNEQAPEMALRTAQQQDLTMSRSMPPPEIDPYGAAPAALNGDIPIMENASPARTGCYPESDCLIGSDEEPIELISEQNKMRNTPVPPLGLWLNSPSLSAYFCQCSLWAYGTQFK